jgi:hypothetical protein
MVGSIKGGLYKHIHKLNADDLTRGFGFQDPMRKHLR